MKKVISTDLAPKAIGPYSQAIVANGFLILSGQIPLNPKSMTIESTTIEDQASQVFQNLRAVLTAAGSSFAKVVKTTVFLTDLKHFEVVNGIYQKAFEGVEAPPARSTIQVSALPKGALIEIEAIALVG
jgi:2-iminobutanoate/2-iminopropanoate deaminase